MGKTVAKIRPPVKWHGGKHYLAQRIIEQFPPHHTYVEPFGGAASVLLNKEPSPVEVWNDLDKRLWNLFQVIKYDHEELHRALSLTMYSENEFEYAGLGAGTSIESAVAFFVRCRQSFGGRGESFSCTKHRVRGGITDVVSAYLSAIDVELPKIVERIRTVQILCRPAIEVIKQWDSPNTLFYCDPPYMHGTRAKGSRDAYDVEMTDEDHYGLVELMTTTKPYGKVILSGYPNPIYDRHLAAWRRLKFDMPNHASGGAKKRRMKECLWMNF